MGRMPDAVATAVVLTGTGDGTVHMIATEG
jgi:hypothetical protein